MLAICVLIANGAPREWYQTPISWGSALFIFIVTIFAYWNDLGGWITLGLICFVGQWGALYAYVVSDNTRTWWFLLLTLSLICYFPVAIEGPYWIIVSGFMLFATAYWLLPIALAKWIHMKQIN